MSIYTASQLAQLHAAIDAKNAGNACEFSNDGGRTWYRVLDSHGSWYLAPDRLFRPKSESKSRPWHMREVPVGAVIIRKDSGAKHVIVSGGVEAIGYGLNSTGNFAWVLENFTMSDGSPCGVIES